VSFTLEVVINPGFFHDLICHVPGLYFPVNCYFDIGGGFAPYVMISPAVMMKNKSMLL
jgi:phenylalanine-4-hydroxylase